MLKKLVKYLIKVHRQQAILRSYFLTRAKDCPFLFNEICPTIRIYFVPVAEVTSENLMSQSLFGSQVKFFVIDYSMIIPFALY